MSHAMDVAPAGYSPVRLQFGPYGPSKLLVARCPSRFQGKYIIRDRIVADSLNASRGSAIHWVLEQITNHQVDPEERGPITPQLLNDWVTQAVGMYPAAYEQVKLVKEAAEAYVGNPPKYRGTHVLTELSLGVALYEEESFIDDAVPNRAYVKVPYNLSGVSGDRGEYNKECYFGGKCDLLIVDDEIKTVTIIDHKSTPSANENSDNNFQVGCYAWLASLYYPGYTIKTVIHFAHPALNFYGPPVHWEHEDLVDIEDEVRMRIRAIESFMEYPALPGAHCSYCHMVQQCPEYIAVEKQNARGDINLNVHGVNDLVRLARQVKVTGELYDTLNKTLKEGIEMFAPTSGVAIEGYWYGFKPGDQKIDWQATERKIKEEVQRAQVRLGENPDDADAQRLVKLNDLEGMLSAHGVSPEAFKQWRADKLKALWKLNKPELLELLRGFVVPDRDTRFGGYKT